MGGVMILLALVVSTLLWADLRSAMVWAVLLVTVGYGAIGFADDWLKVTKRNTKGVSGRMKLLTQAAIGLAAAVWISMLMPAALADRLAVPFFKEVLIPFGILFPLIAMFVMMGASNAVNLTDGLDGLAIVPVMIAAAVFALIAYLVGNRVFADYLQLHYVPGTGELAVLASALIGSALGFLWFNAPPAAVFMGDTGSLSLGGALGGLAVATKHEIVLAIRRRPVRGRDGLRDDPGVLVQADRPAGLPDGAAAPPFREEGLGRADHRHPLLDHRDDPGADRPRHAEDPMNSPSPPFRPFLGARIAVVGLGRAGLPAAQRLAAWGAEVEAWDDREAAREDAAAAGLLLRDPAEGRFRADALLLSPGIPHRLPRAHPAAEAARRAHAPILCDVEFLYRAVLAAHSRARFVGVTGTNGKSTTTALIHHMLGGAGRRAQVWGNLGPAALSLNILGDDGIYTLEMSSTCWSEIATLTLSTWL